ncbi:hypothetical protein QZH41_012120 [Actinostola sp. cb2023]|nr:hypothetical protein QZH41_012120 [Actinostola sp. cb2023]
MFRPPERFQIVSTHFCANLKDDLYPDKDDLSRFIVCTHGLAITKKCPKGLLFNKDLKVCDWPRNVVL